MDDILYFYEYQDTNPLILDLTNEMTIDTFKKMKQCRYNAIKCKNLDNGNIYLNLTNFETFYNKIFDTDIFNNILEKYNRFYFYIDEYKSCYIEYVDLDKTKI